MDYTPLTSAEISTLTFEENNLYTLLISRSSQGTKALTDLQNFILDIRVKIQKTESNTSTEVEVPLNAEAEKLSAEQKKYSFIFGGDLILSYFRLYESNLNQLNKYKVTDNKDQSIQPKDNTVVRVPNAVQYAPDVNQEDGEPEPIALADSNATFSEPLEPTTVAKTVAKTASDLALGQDGGNALLAHANTISAFQRLWPLKNSDQVGMFGVTDKVLKQAGFTPTLVFETNSREPEYYQNQLKSSDDPRLDPEKLSSISVNLSVKLANSLGVKPTDFNPDLNAYVLRFGLEDSALLATLKEVNFLDTSADGSSILSQTLKRYMLTFNTIYSVQDFNYLDNYKQISQNLNRNTIS